MAARHLSSRFAALVLGLLAVSSATTVMPTMTPRVLPTAAGLPSALGVDRGGADLVLAPKDFHPNALLGTAERIVSAFQSLPTAPKRLAHALYGLVLVRHGGQFTNTMIFLQAFRVTAFPIFQRAVPELQESYRRASETAKEQAPNINKARAAAAALKEELPEALATAKAAIKELEQLEKQLRSAEKVQKSLSSAKAGDVHPAMIKAAVAEVQELAGKRASAEAVASRAQASVVNMRASLALATEAAGGIEAVLSAVNPGLVGEVIKGLGAGVMSCVAVTTQPLAGKLTSGADLGGMVGDKASDLVGSVLGNTASPPAATKWVCGAAQSACVAGAMFAAYKARELVLTVSAAALGAKIVATCVADQVEASLGVKLFEVSVVGLVEKAKYALLDANPEIAKASSALAAQMGPIAAPTSAAGCLELGVLAFGLAKQLGPGGGSGMPLALKAPLAPILVLESTLKGYAAKSAAGAAAAAAAK